MKNNGKIKDSIRTYDPFGMKFMKNQSFEKILNRRIDTTIDEMKNGNQFTRKEAQKKYQVLADIRASIARQKFYERHSTGKLKDL